MRILGLNIASTVNQHDPAAVLLIDGKPVSMFEEERLTRVKHAYGQFPSRSIEKCLVNNNLSMRDIDIIAIPSVTHLDLPGKIQKILFAIYGHCPELEFWEHHISHVASAVNFANFTSGIFLSLDGWGDGRSGSAGYFSAAIGTKELINLDRSSSLGNFYSAMSQFLGFSGFGDEYKVMGMSGYGRPGQFAFEQLIQISKGKIDIDQNLYNSEVNNVKHQIRYNPDFLIGRFGNPKLPSEPFLQRHFDFARSIQDAYYAALKSLVQQLVEETGHRKIALSGGCALNCAANGKLIEEGVIDEIFVQPAATDQGTALGAAVLSAKKHGEILKLEKWTPFLGSDFGEEFTLSSLKNFGVKFQKMNNVYDFAAHQLTEGRIIGWFQGKSEFGPRALGNRSILANPTVSKIKETINAKVKFREEFRPFAPAVLQEKADQYFNIEQSSPHMTIAFRGLEGVEEQIPGVVHVDKTARVQTVAASDNPKFHMLLTAFENETGIPILVNTSFNIKNEPIVDSPQDALRTFYSSGLDHLIMGDFVVSKF